MLIVAYCNFWYIQEATVVFSLMLTPKETKPNKTKQKTKPNKKQKSKKIPGISPLLFFLSMAIPP